MKKNAKIFVAGHRGLVGSALVRKLEFYGYTNLLLRTFSELDLTNQQSVEEFFGSEKPDYVFLAAAKVGGIKANNTFPADFIFQNLAIQTNVIHLSWKYGVKRLLFLGSSCIYPKMAPQPLKEEYLLSGFLEPTNEPYAIAKIAGIKMCEAYNRQYNTAFASVMPTNLYGPGDNFDLETSHVLPALIRKFHEAKSINADSLTLWGTGSPRREFLHVEDMAEACVYIMNLKQETFADNFLAYPEPSFVNVGCGDDISIDNLASLVAKVVGFRGKIFFDPDKPDGTPRKLLDIAKISRLGWSPSRNLINGIADTYSWYCDNYIQ